MSDEVLDRVAEWIAAADHVSVLTGAGISTDSGIPDFRGPQGVWTKDPAAERKATIDAWREDAELRREAWAFRLANRDAGFEPNASHRALVELEARDRLDVLVTQNVDGLHLDAGTRRERLIEVHGSYRDVVCLTCGHRQPTEAVLDRVAAGEADPHCTVPRPPDGSPCGGLLKSGTISFGQSLVEEDLRSAQEAAERADVFLALGTSLAVYPVAYLPLIAKQTGGRLVIVNGEPTEMDPIADAVLLAGLGDVLPDLVGRVSSRLGAN